MRHMTVLTSYNMRRVFFVFAGVFSAAVFDLGVNSPMAALNFYDVSAHGDSMASVFVLLWALILGLLAFALERYVRPMSRIGAISTGFCGYALISFLAL